MIPVPNTSENRRDPFYRYTRPALHTRQEKHYIVLVNLQEIAKALQCKKSHLIRYIRKKTCQHVVDGCKVRHLEEGDRIIESFIRKKLCCPLCYLPEMNAGQCKACGYH